jgi:long-chain fatty acid transport protein
MARGGAFIAAPDDLLAIHYNPSGLSLLKGLHVAGDLQIVGYQMTFERSCPCLPDGTPDKEAKEAALQAGFDANPSKTNTPIAIPFLGLGYGIDFLDLTLAFGIWGPTSGRHNYGELPGATAPSFPTRAAEQPGRYSGLEVVSLEANFALGLALSPFEGLRLGASVMIFQGGNDQTLHLWANLPSLVAGPEDPNFDVPVTFAFKENLKLTWQVGAAYDIPYIPGRLTLGASFRAKRDMRTNGTIEVGLPEKLADVATVTGDEVTVELSTAPIFRAGLQYAIDKVFRVEGAFVFEGWSAHDQVVVRPQNISFQLALDQDGDGMNDTIALDKIVANRFWRDTWSLRLGGEINLFEPYLGIRAGYFYEPTAITLDRVDPSRVDLDKHGIGAGVSTSWYGVTLEVSGMYVALTTGVATESKTRIVSPLAFDGGENNVTTIGNGTYSGRYLIFSASLRFALDPLLSIIEEAEAEDKPPEMKTVAPEEGPSGAL